MIARGGPHGWQTGALLVLLISYAAPAAFQPVAADARQDAAPPIVLRGLCDLPLRCVLVRERDVLASNQSGLFRASRSDKRWHRLPLDDAVPRSGFFATASPSATDIWYYAPRWVLVDLPNRDNRVPGLYRSRDDGRHWELVTSQYDLQEVFVHPNGVLYAIIRVQWEEPRRSPHRQMVWEREGTGDGPRVYIRDRLIMSRDEGRTWADITGNIAAGMSLDRMFVDPDHPALICVRGNLIRGVILHASDDRYEWEVTRWWDWLEKHQTDEAFFDRGLSTQTTAYMFHATLGNYFQHDFGGRAELPGFDIVPEEALYTFDIGEPKIIQVAVRFLPPKHEVKLADLKDEVGFWGMRVVDPDGNRVGVDAPLQAKWYVSRNRPDVIAEVRQAAGFEVHSLNAHQPYERSIDIGQLYRFDRKGKYLVQLMYNSTPFADRRAGEWPGSFTSRVFEVNLR